MNRANPLWDSGIAFLRRALPKPPATVLDVGCGRGEVAAKLLKLGYSVTAIDPDPRAVGAAKRHGVTAIRASIQSFAGGPFDACVCVYTLHHLASLSNAVKRVRLLLKPGGRFLVVDYAWEEADEPTATWLYDHLGAFVSAGVAKARWGLPGPGDSPRMFWRHLHDGRSGEREQSGRSTIRAVRSQFRSVGIERTPYLFATVSGQVSGARRAAVSRYLLELEVRQIQKGALRPLGIQLVAKAPLT